MNHKKNNLRCKESRVALGLAFSGRNIGGVRRYIENIERNSSFNITLFPNYHCDGLWKQKYQMEVINDYKANELIKNQQKIIDEHDVFHSNVDPTFIRLCEEAQKQGKKWIHTYHNLYKPSDEPEHRLKDWQKEINDVLFEVAQKADIKICVSHWLVDELKKRNISSSYLPNFVDLEYLNKNSGLSDDQKNKYQKFVLFIGDNSIRKNCVEFLKVAQICPEYNFLLIGAGLDKDSLEKTYHIKLSDNVFPLGPCQHDKALQFISACSLLVMNSFTEGLPTVLLEAMAYMKPCIIPNGPDWAKPLFKNNEGYKYDLGDIIDLKNKIDLIQNNYSLIPQAQQFVINNFSSHGVLDKIDQLYAAL